MAKRKLEIGRVYDTRIITRDVGGALYVGKTPKTRARYLPTVAFKLSGAQEDMEYWWFEEDSYFFEGEKLIITYATRGEPLSDLPRAVLEDRLRKAGLWE